MMKIFLFAFLLVSVGLTACSTNVNESKSKIEGKIIEPNQNISSKSSKFTYIRPDEAKKRLEREKGIILLDVRTKEEYVEKHIRLIC